jgi:phosphorylcholine metabolism protein LicD
MNKSIITQKQANELYKTAKFIHDAFVKYKIKYWMVGGTLLGAVRHSGVIPADDDLDFCILKEEVPKLKKLIPYFDKHGYDLEEMKEEDGEEKECSKRKDSCTWFVSCRGKDCLGADIFVMFSKGNKVTYYDPYWETAENGGKKCYFEKDLLFPLLPYRFGNFFLYGPHNALEHLNRCYGPSWVEKGQVLFNHRTGKWVNSKPRNLTVNEFLTFRAPSSTCNSKVPEVVCHSSQSKYFSKSPVTSRSLKEKENKKTSRKISRKKTVKRSPKKIPRKK